MSDTTLNTEIIRQLAEVLHETKLNEIKYEAGGVKIKIARHDPPMLVSSAPALPTPPPFAAPEGTGAVDPAQHAGAVKSPMVGTVYLAPEPGAAPFVQPNDVVTAGQTLLVIEAMKVMNMIRAPRSGTVKQVLVSNAAPVEFDEVLMIIE